MSDTLTLPGFDIEATPDAQLRSEEARRLFEQMDEAGPVLDDYFALRAKGYSWRVAVFIVWASLPADRRWPRTQGELATQVLGLTSDRRVREWRANNPAVEAEVRTLQVSALEKSRARIIGALIESASNPDPRASADRKVALEMLGEYTPKQAVLSGVVDLTERDTADLVAGAQIPGMVVDGESTAG
jgi:hypothetical protein